jgi:hypothetical protein
MVGVLRDARGAAADRSPIFATGAPGKLRKQVSMFVGPRRAAMAQARTDLAKATEASKAPSAVEANVAPYLAAFGGGQDTLSHVLQTYRDSQAGLHGQLDSANLKLLAEHIANLEAAAAKGSKLNLSAVASDANAYRARQAVIEPQKAALDLNQDPQMARALEIRYARMQIPGTTWMDPVTHPDVIAGRRAAGATLRTATKALSDAQRVADKTTGRLGGMSSAVADSQRQIPLHPVNDTFQNNLLDARASINQAKVTSAAQHGSNIAALTDAKGWAQAEYKNAKQDKTQLGGLVVKDQSVRPVGSGPLKGAQVRPLLGPEIRQHMLDSGVSPAHVSMTNPERMRPMTTNDIFNVGRHSGRPSATGVPVTGRAALTGDWVPGHVGLARSQQADVAQIGRASMEQGFLNRFSMKDANGQTRYFTPQDWQNTATAYEKQNHIPLQDVALADGRVILIPKIQIKEMQAHLKLEDPTPPAKLALKVNRGWRNTVLAMSTKLPFMHDLEGVTRMGLAGATPQSFGLARATFKAQDALGATEDAATLKNLTTPGAQSGQAASLNSEDLGRLVPHDRSPILNAVTAPARLWTDTAHGIIGLQRLIEKPAQTAVLGVHIRQSLQEFGYTWAKANSATASVAEDAARLYSPSLHAAGSPEAAAATARVEDAARLNHEAVGQYNSFNAATRQIISRFAQFAPWYMNATKLVFKQLPLHHPLKTAAITELAQANQSQWDAVRRGLPANMQTDTILGPGHWLDIGKFGPLGLEKSMVGEITPLLVPAYQSALQALFAGNDPFGKPMKGPPGSTPYGTPAVPPQGGSAALHALDTFLQGVAGPIGPLARAIKDHGATPYSDQMPLLSGLNGVQTKPGTQHGPANALGGLERVFNPFVGIYYKNGGAGPQLTGQMPAGTGPRQRLPSTRQRLTGYPRQRLTASPLTRRP